MKLGKIGELSKCRGQGAGSRGQESSRLPSLEGLGDLLGSPPWRGRGWVKEVLQFCGSAVLQLFKF